MAPAGRRILKYMLDQTIDLDRTFQALADKSRRGMVERLTLGPASVSELAEPLAMSLAAVVQHVQVLEGCGVVRTEKVGRTRMCRIEPAAMTAAEQWITDRRRSWEARLDRLGDREFAVIEYQVDASGGVTQEMIRQMIRRFDEEVLRFEQFLGNN